VNEAAFASMSGLDKGGAVSEDKRVLFDKEPAEGSHDTVRRQFDNLEHRAKRDQRGAPDRAQGKETKG